MKFTTLNFKKDEYAEKHEVIVGTHIGCLKKIDVTHENPHVQVNLQDLKSLNKDSIITALNFRNLNKDELLVGRANKIVQIYDMKANIFTHSIEFSSSPIVGLCCYNDDRIIAGLENGNIEILQLQHSSNQAPVVLNAGDNISRMRQCRENENFIATGGKERQNNLKVFDLETEKMIFKSKNLPNDFLQLEVPIWDTDIGFINAHTLTTCSRYGYIRLYDIRAQRRPIKKYSNESLNFSCMSVQENNVYAGTIKGELKAFDIRNLKTFAHTYKGCTGSVSDVFVDDTGKFLTSACLDRYVRVHDTNNCVLLYQCYVKTKGTRVLVRNIENDNDHNNEIEEHKTLNDDNKNKYGSDDEYEQIFENMETITETNKQNKSSVANKRKKGENKKLKTKRNKI